MLKISGGVTPLPIRHYSMFLISELVRFYLYLIWLIQTKPILVFSLAFFYVLWIFVKKLLF